MKEEKDVRKEIKNQSRMLLILALFLLVAVTAGVSYAFFNYVRLGTTENAITTGTITFLYDEVNQAGNGISIHDAFPMTDQNGIQQTGSDHVFQFKIIATTTGNTSLPYEITARKKNDSTAPDTAIKLYLAEVNEGIETASSYTLNGDVVRKYSELISTTIDVGSDITEKTIYQATIPPNSNRYEKNFTLKMWVADDVDFSPNQELEQDTYPMNNQTFTVTVNVYANATVVVAGQ